MKAFDIFTRTKHATSQIKSPDLVRARDVYADFASATPVSAAAQRAMQEAMDIYANPSAIHRVGVQAHELLEASRGLIAAACNVRAHEVVFVGTGTEGCNLAIRGTVHTYRAAHDDIPHIVSSPYEHPAVRETINGLVQDGMVTVSYIPLRATGDLDVQALSGLMKENTIMVCVMYIQNELGIVAPLGHIHRAIAAYKKKLGRDDTHKKTRSYPYLFTDACQASNAFTLDTLSLGVDMMVINSSKVYGPKGIAALTVKEGCMIDPVITGGGHERNRRSGTQSPVLAAGFAAALTEAQRDREHYTQSMEELRDLLEAKLKELLPQCELFGTDAVRAPSFSNVLVPGMPSDETIIRLSEKGVYVSHMSSCASDKEDASYVLTSLGVGEDKARSNIRITLGKGMTKNDILTIITELTTIVRTYSK